ncbi:MAG: hypothetical protein JW753_01950 [Dehalococcoidia bacterium]|nr:hypothetical protein [Dehalococcoidia bacterium]
MATRYLATALITLTATPVTGYVFVGWTGEVDVIADPSQTMVTFAMGDDPDNNRHITANFVQSDLRYSLAAAIEPSGGGSIEFSEAHPPGGYLVNDNVSVYAKAGTGYVFSHWTGDLAGTDNPRTVLVNDNRSIVAIFNPTVAVYCSPTIGGSVVLEPESSNGYAVGKEVTITAKAAKGYRFDYWEGDLSGSKKSVTVYVDVPLTVTARFAEQSSRWWLWLIVGLIGLVGAVILLRLVSARRDRETWDEFLPPEG